MTVAERNNILSKECLTISDIKRLYDFNDNQASKFIIDIKNRLKIGKKQALRLEMQGRIHTQDYLDGLNVVGDRYSIKVSEEKGEAV